MDILLDRYGDLFINPQKGDIELKNSVAQKIRIKLLWFEREWKWNREEGMPYFERILVSNPDVRYIEELVRKKIFEIDEVVKVDGISVTVDKKTRKAVIRYTAYTDFETIKEEVEIRCLITE